MMKKSCRFFLFTLTFCIITITPTVINGCPGGFTCPDIPDIHFSIAFLSPNTDNARNQWVILIQEQLREIGIDVYTVELTNSENIAPRSWSYPLIDYDYIPTYAEGGFDVLFSGRNWNKDMDTGRMFITGCWSSGENYYQYVNPHYDSNLSRYEMTYDIFERDEYAHKLQNILYEDLPTISILYETSFFLFDEASSGLDSDMLKIRCHHSENWNLSDSSKLIYCNMYEPNSYTGFQLEKEKYYDSYQNFDHLWAQCVYGSLYQRNVTDNRYIPYIAQNSSIIPYEIEPGWEGISILVDINPNAKFSNGDSVLAEDVKYSYDLHLSSSAHSSSSSHLLKEYFLSNESITAIDADTVRFNLSDYFNFPFSLLSYGIIDKSVVEPIVSSYGYEVLKESPYSSNTSDSLVASCGPYKLDYYNSSENKVELSKNEYWFGLTQGLSNITFISIPDKDEALEMLLEKKADVLDESYNFDNQVLELSSDFYVDFFGAYFEPLNHQEMGINMRHPILGTGELTPVGTAEAAKNVRKAISYMIPRERIINEILNGSGRSGITPVPPGCIGFNDNLDEYDWFTATAEHYLLSAGYPPCYDVTCSSFNIFQVTLFIPLFVLMIICRLRQKKNRR